MPTEVIGRKAKKALKSRKDYSSAVENLKRFAQMNGGRLTLPTDIVKRESCGQWQSGVSYDKRKLLHSSRGGGS